MGKSGITKQSLETLASGIKKTAAAAAIALAIPATSYAQQVTDCTSRPTINQVNLRFDPSESPIRVRDRTNLDIPYDKAVYITPQRAVIIDNGQKREITTRLQVRIGRDPQNVGVYLSDPNGARANFTPNANGYIFFNPEDHGIKPGQGFDLQVEYPCKQTVLIFAKQGQPTFAPAQPTSTPIQSAPTPPTVTPEGTKVNVKTEGNNIIIENKNDININIEREKLAAASQGSGDSARASGSFGDRPGYGLISLLGVLGNDQYTLRVDPEETFKGIKIGGKYRGDKLRGSGDFTWLKSDKDEEDIAKRRINSLTTKFNGSVGGRFLGYGLAEGDIFYIQHRYSPQAKDRNMFILERTSEFGMVARGGAIVAWPYQDDGFASDFFATASYGLGRGRMSFDLQDNMFFPNVNIDPMTLKYSHVFDLGAHLKYADVGFRRMNFENTRDTLEGVTNDFSAVAYLPMSLFSGPEKVQLTFGLERSKLSQTGGAAIIHERQTTQFVGGVTFKF